MEKRLITAALPYINAVPHLGNIVGSHLPADIFSRYCRLKGYDTVFIGGTDEHGTATEIAAKQHKVTPKQLADFFYKIHKEIYDWFNLSYDNFNAHKDIVRLINERVKFAKSELGENDDCLPIISVNGKIHQYVFVDECSRGFTHKRIIEEWNNLDKLHMHQGFFLFCSIVLLLGQAF